MQIPYTFMRNPNENDQELQDADKITPDPHRSYIAHIKYSDDNDVNGSIEELKKISNSVLKMINFDNVYLLSLMV